MARDARPYFRVGEAYQPSFGPSGDHLSFVTNKGDVPQAYVLDGPNASPEAITSSNNETTFAIWSPTQELLVVAEDRRGGEYNEYFRYDYANSSVRPIFEDEKMHWWGGWSRDGRRFAFSSNKRDESQFDVYLHDIESSRTELIHKTDGWYSIVDWGPDDERLLLRRTNSPTDHDLAVLSLIDGSLEWITSADTEGEFHSLNWILEYDSIYCVTNYGSEANYVARLDVETGSMSKLVEDEKWTIDGINVHAATGRFVYGQNREGYADLTVGTLTDRESFNRLASPDLPPGVMGEATFSPDGKRVGMTVSSRVTGTNVHVVNIERGRQRQWTDVSMEQFDQSRLVEPELVKYNSFDGLEIHAYYTLPAEYEPGEEVPVILDVHGGPESQRRPAFNDAVQYFLDNGYAVFEPNIRGSTGYGTSYAALDDGRNRLNAISDIRAGVEWLHHQPAVDEEGIAIQGSSYGGFVALLSAASHPELWSAVVDIAGITNLVSFLENTGDWRRELREAEYGSLDDDYDFLQSISPINNIENIEAPILVVHGKKDQRVPLDEAKQLVAEAERNGVAIESLLLDDEGHQFKSASTRTEIYQRVAEFLERTVKETS